MQDRDRTLENLMGSAALRLLPEDWQTACLRLCLEAGTLSCRIEPPAGVAVREITPDDRLRVAARLFFHHCVASGHAPLSLSYVFFRRANKDWCWRRQQGSSQDRSLAAV